MTFWDDPLRFVTNYLTVLLSDWGLSVGWITFIQYFLGALALIIFAMILDIGLVWVERKVVARFQDRLGPNRLGPFGLLQPLADIIKMIIKEDITPANADKVLYNLAPVLAAVAVIALWAVLPLASTIYGVDLNVGLLYLLAAGALGTLAVLIAGWASNNKYALLGALRMIASLVSYEIPMALVLLIPAMLSGTMSLRGIAEAQRSLWFALLSPLGCLIFLISAIAELGRAPFDLSEAESEIVAGYHIEYTGMKFGWFYAAELLHAFTFGGFLGLLFFGGYTGFFGLEQWKAFSWLNNPFVQAATFLGKAMLGYWVIMWVKYSMPRLRIDHMLAFNWKFLTPLALAVLMVTAVLHRLFLDAPRLTYVLVMLSSNLLIALAAVEMLRAHARRQRRSEPATGRPTPSQEQVP